MSFAFTSVHISVFKGSRRGIDLARSAVLRQWLSTLPSKVFGFQALLIEVASSIVHVHAWGDSVCII